MKTLPAAFSLHPSVASAQQEKQAIVALESTVITHGLPRPQNLQLAQEMEETVRAEGATPATIALMHGEVKIGLTPAELQELSLAENALKISLRDFASSLLTGKPGGTTVAGTMFAAHAASLSVFATGGIGGVHKEARYDVSTDLQALASLPLMVVCAGAKSILDLPATLEYLETMGVPVIGYGTDTFPEFFSPSSGLPVSLRLDSAAQVVQFARQHWVLGMKSAVLVCQPLPAELTIPAGEIEPVLRQVSQEVTEKGIRGQKVTPYELLRVNELTAGKSMQANLSLLKNNARLAAQIALAYRD
jgi:pseudouridine-5'-phosphate glycosidase